jgi:hypothetical protein
VNRLAKYSLVAFSLAVAACGGSSPGVTTTTTAAEPLTTNISVSTDPANLPKSINDTVVAIRVASLLSEFGPVGSAETRQRSDPLAQWSRKSSTEANGCTTTETTNADSFPNVGDSEKVTGVGCEVIHQSGTPQKFNYTYFNELLSFSNPPNLTSENWQYNTKGVTKLSGGFAAIQVAGKYNFDARSQSTITNTTNSSHFSDNTQVDEQIWTVSGTSTSSLGNSEIEVQSRYSCRYVAGASTNPDCSDVRTTLNGKIYGIALTAVMTRVSASPVIFQIESGSVKFTLEVTAYSINVNRKMFKLTTPTGEVVNLTGEDTNWIGV